MTNIVETPKKRGRKRKSKRYFTDITQAAIIAFNNLDSDDIRRDKIYSRFIKYPFEKLTENVINTFKFTYIDLPYEDIQHECVAHLNEKISKYKTQNGKAFSYFTVIARNWCIIENRKAYEKRKVHDNETAIDTSRNVMNEVLRSELQDELKEFMDLFIEYFDKNLTFYFPKEKDIVVADAVLELFKHRANIESFNKKALYMLIREHSRTRTQYITKIVNIFKRKFERMYIVYKTSGKIIDPDITDLSRKARKK